jgi:hypothetical protein
MEMTRAEKRRLMKNDIKQAKTPTYQFTKEQIDVMIQTEVEKRLDEVKKEITEESITAAMELLFVLPMEVLMDNFWQKSYTQKIPKFTELLLDYYQAWENGELDMDKMKEDLWKYGGIRLQQVDN